jgi:hypothetical protein
MIHREFIEAGFRIFPIWPTDKNGNCTCGKEHCIGAGKHPRSQNWPSSPNWDEEQLETMEQFSSLATHYGVVCKGMLVIDVDARNGGVESFKKLCKAIPQLDLEAGLVVTTGSGGGSRHYYFSVDQSISLLSHHPEYPGVDFQHGSKYVVGPGSKHKSGKTYTADGSPYDIGPAPDALVDLLRIPERHRTEYNGTSLDVSHKDIADMLAYVHNDDLHYDDWVKIGMSIHQATGGSGYELWRLWSATSPKHDETMMEARWHSFGKCTNPVTIGTLVYHAEQGGWIAPVTFDGGEAFSDQGATSDNDDDVDFLDTSNVNLKSPPGFVGELAEWIESRNRRPRLNLAVAGALVAMGNIAGLRYAANWTTTNMLAFCVAGSGSGKEATLQSVNTIMRAAGISAAVHGAIKSEQEIIRNLVRHQAAFYNIDEIGIFLQKIASAQKRGGAVYLEAVIGQIMAVYSKADEYYALSGDAKEEVKKSLKTELSQVTRRAEEGEISDAAFEEARARINQQLRSLDNGLWRPFLSLLGFTTPVTFDGAVTFESATNGFFSRAIIFNERDTAPRSKANFQKTEMPEAMRNTIIRIATGDHYDMMENRVEAKADWIEIPSDNAAAALLEKTGTWFDDQAQEASSRNGLESLWLRAQEQVLKVSLILAVPSGLRTAEHVRWAFALVKRDITEKSQLVISNTPYKEEASDAIRMKVLNICSDEEGSTFGKIKNCLRPRKPEEVEAAIEDLVKRGRIKKIETKHKRNKSVVVKYVAMKA